MILVCLCFLLWMTCLSQGRLHAEEISLTSCNWHPYVGENLPGFGFTSEIISQAFQQAGDTVTFTILPWKRALYLTQSGEFDAVYSGYYSEERASVYALSNPYTQSAVFLCALKESAVNYKSLKDLQPYLIGVVRGYVNGPEFDRATYLRRDEAFSDLNNLGKLMAKRVDIIVIDKFVALYYLKNSPFSEGDIDRVEFLQPPLKVMPVHVMFSKAVPGFQKKVAVFNAGLEQIRKNGVMDQIMEKYGFLDHE